MEMESTEATDKYLETQSILLAASNHNLQDLRILLRTGSASVQDSETKTTPLHAAIAACEGLVESGLPAQNNSSSDANGITWKEGHSHGNVKNEDSLQCSAEDGENNDWRVEDVRGVPEAGKGERIAAATQIVKFLLENGAIWNDVDANNETPGCLARRLGLKELYEIMVDAGVRAEMLLNRLDEYEMLMDVEEDNEGDYAGRSDYTSANHTDSSRR